MGRDPPAAQGRKSHQSRAEQEHAAGLGNDDELGAAEAALRRTRGELARVYRAARNGDVSTEHARALAALLGDIRRCFIVEDSAIQPQAPGRRLPFETKQ